MLQKPSLRCHVKITEEMTEEYIQRAKELKPTYKYNEKWAAYTQSIASSKPSNVLLALFPVLPALSQIITLFKTTYFMKSCVQVFIDQAGQRTRNPLKFSECLALNNESIYLKSDDEDDEMRIYLAFVLYGLMYLLYFLNIHEIFVQSKYIVKMLGIGVRIPSGLKTRDFIRISITLVLQLGVGWVRYIEHDTFIFKDHPNDPKSYYRFDVTQTISNAVVSTIQLMLIFSCFFSILYKAHKDPCSFYVKLNDFLHLGDINEFQFNNINYIINNSNSLMVIQQFFHHKKNKEEETLILLASLEYLKDCDVVVTKERNCADSSNETIL